MVGLTPVETTHLFPILREKLQELLAGLSPQDWERRATPNWSVKDVAAHLLDTSLRRVSMGRDGYWGESFNGATAEEFNAFLNGLNHDWVRALRRMSPEVITSLLEVADRNLCQYLTSLDPNEKALFAVSWAGEQESQNWFDVAREYTERWHHQQQIREATGRPGILDDELYTPVLRTFIRALPVAYRDARPVASAKIVFRIIGTGGGEWTLQGDNGSWVLSAGSSQEAACIVSIRSDAAWKLFTKGLTDQEARRVIQTEGDATLAEPLYSARAIVG